MADTRKLNKDEYLFREGDFPDNMYIVRSGTLAITKTKNKSEVTLAEIQPGAIVGEMALFDKKPRSANVKATRETEVVSLPYKNLEQQLAQLPEWIRAIIRKLNQNLRDANQKIKELGQTESEEERYSPQTINKLLAIFNFVTLKYGKKESDGYYVPPGTLRKYTIQVFLTPTNKMNSFTLALKDVGYADVIDKGEGKQDIINKRMDFLFDFSEWYNDWLMKAESDRIQFTSEEIKMLKGVVEYAKKAPSGLNNKKLVSIEHVQMNSKNDFGIVIRPDFFTTLSSKGLCSDKTMTKDGVVVEVLAEDLEKTYQFFHLLDHLKNNLK